MVAVPEHAQARKQFQWKPIAGYLCWHWGPAGVSQDRVGAGLLNSKIMEINDRASISTSSV
jgi:hypothetical protein